MRGYINLYLSALANIIFVSDDFITFLDDILSWEEGTNYIGAGAGFSYKTPVGPISIWYTSIGFTF